ncbi:hypothetical protein AHAS_Ahas07G0093400 [Arachis hypogaea]
MKATEALADTLRKRNKEVVQNAKEVISATEESLKSQVALLALDINVSRIGTFKTIYDGQIVDLDIEKRV